MKFSIIVPVYNVEKYIEKCLLSILHQTYDDFEAIIVNDGSPDHSQTIINKFTDSDSRFISVTKENGGLSDARNFGLQFVKGDYIIFLDSDDYWNEELLMNLSKEIEKNPKLDVIKFKATLLSEDGQYLSEFSHECFSNYNVNDALSVLLKANAFEPAWLYAYRSDFFLSNKFLYPKGKLHEDFGLTPYVISLSKYISAIDYVGYNYLQRGGSIMNLDSSEVRLRKANDVFEHYCNLKKRIREESTLNETNMKALFNYLARSVIVKYSVLDKSDKKDFKKKLMKEQIQKDLLDDTFVRKIKKMYFLLKNW